MTAEEWFEMTHTLGPVEPKLLTLRTTQFSDDRKYRYTLRSVWGDSRSLAVIMLNPSTADEQKNDPTVTRVFKHAEKHGFLDVTILNLFAFRATVPAVLQRVDDPVGPENDHWITEVVEQSSQVWVAWGNLGSWFGRDLIVRQLIGHRPLYCFAQNANGQPKHPLYCSGSDRVKLWHG